MLRGRRNSCQVIIVHKIKKIPAIAGIFCDHGLIIYQSNGLSSFLYSITIGKCSHFNSDANPRRR